MVLLALSHELAPARLAVVQENCAWLQHWFTWCHHPYLKSSNEAFVQQAVYRHQRQTGAYFALMCQQQYLGEIAIDACCQGTQGGNVYYWVGARHQCKGYAQKALQCLTIWARGHMALGHLQVIAEQGNVASNVVARRAGAQLVATRADFCTSLGRITTVNEYHITL